MSIHRLVLAAAGAAALAGGFAWYANGGYTAAVVEAGGSPQETSAAMADGGKFTTAAVGHQFRQDDFPAVTLAPDGSLWVAWLSFDGARDDVAIRHYKDGKWGNLLWVPNTSGDSWLPQVAADSANRVWVVWSQQVKGNWDLYARRFDPATQLWSPLERLTSDPLPDINPRMASDGKGHLALVWQGYRGSKANIFLKTFDGQKWSREVRVTHHAANDWEPSVALDSKGTAWVAYDSYKNGNYDIFVTKVAGGEVQGAEIPIAQTARFETRATVAVDTADRVWVAWEAGQPNWGKDNGYTIRTRAPGVQLGGLREPRIACLDGGQWRTPAQALSAVFKAGDTYQPHVFSDGRGSVWVLAKTRLTAASLNRKAGTGAYWDYRLTHFDGSGWSPETIVPNSKGRSSTRVNAVAASDGTLWLTWPTDNRAEGNYHRPLRQQVYVGSVPAPAAASATEWRNQPEDAIEAKKGHDNEAADIKAIRTYTAEIGGKPHHIVRGDFHRHTELSWDGGGATDGSLQDFYRYMIDVASMDFGASTDHQGGAWPYWWWYTQKMTDMYHVPVSGGYVPIFGYERSAIFPNGHRNMFFAKRSESRVTPWNLKDGATGFGLPLGPQGDEPGVGTGELTENDTKLLYEDVRARNGIAISHTSGTRMGTDWRDNDAQVEPVVEIFQGCRTSYEILGAPLAVEQAKDDAHMKQAGYQPSGFVNNAWAKGYKLGITASSDHNSTHISYAVVYTDDPSRQGVLNAIRKRHTYGAMDNIILEVRMGEHFMGDEFALTAAQPIQVKIHAPRSIAKVSIIKDSKVIYSTEPKKRDVQLDYTDKGAVNGRHYYYVRVEQDDQMLAWSSPMFINYK